MDWLKKSDDFGKNVDTKAIKERMKEIEEDIKKYEADLKRLEKIKEIFDETEFTGSLYSDFMDEVREKEEVLKDWINNNKDILDGYKEKLKEE